MGWNLENYGASKYKATNGGVELIALIAGVIKKNQVDVVGFCEIRSKLADDIGSNITAKLGLGWKYNNSSPAFGKGRWEQYLFVWNENKVKTYKAFQSDFVNPARPPANLGFPRQSYLDRPPLLGYFETVAVPKKKVLVAIMHSPAPTPTFRPRDAARNLALAAVLKNEGDTCVLVGDFNVKANVDATVANSAGAAAFGDLLTAGFQQRLPADVLSSLIPKKKAWIGMDNDECKSSPYDQLFCRRAGGINFRNEGVEDLIVESVSVGTPNVLIPSTGGNYLQPLLAAIHGKNNGGSPPAKYSTVEDAFEAYRVFVSDHLPVVVEVLIDNPHV
jgi:hypothetical protein